MIQIDAEGVVAQTTLTGTNLSTKENNDTDTNRAV